MSDQSPPRLGLKLTKSASLQELIQMRLEEENIGLVQDENIGFVEEEDIGLVQDENIGFVQEENIGLVQDENIGLVQDENIGFAIATNGEKRKAANFHATVLRIGSWEWMSRYRGDLVAKIYFAKQKLIWEVLEEGLKSKMEFPWSDIKGLKTYLPENQPGTLTIVLARPPMFSKEINQQPQKHTQWDSTSDFTNGQASKYKQHILQCRPGILNKHLENLFQSDPRLFSLSQKPEISLESPFFDVGPSILEEPSVFGSQNMAAYTVVAQTPSEHMTLSHEELLPSSGVVEASVDLRNTTGWDQMNVTGLEESDVNYWIDIPDDMFVNSEVNSFENILGSTTNSQLNSDVGPNIRKEIGVDNMNGHIMENYLSMCYEWAMKESCCSGRISTVEDKVTSTAEQTVKSTMEEEVKILTESEINEFFAKAEKQLNEKIEEKYDLEFDFINP